MSVKSPLYVRVGGEEGIAQLVVDFYNRVLSDPELAPFFENASVDRLRTMQLEFFSAALGGPVIYTGKPIYAVHAGRGIRRKHFARFADHLFDTLQTFELSEQEVTEIVGRINTYADEVIGTQGPAS